VLDVGCGRGYAGDFIRAAGGDYTGADFVCSRKGFRLTLADASRLPFPDNSFDGVMCIDAFEHFPDPEAAARELRRVLRPGGWLFLSVPNYANVAGLVKWFCERAGRYDRDSWAPFGNWTPQELEHPLGSGQVRRIFGCAGFSELTRVAFDPDVGMGLFPWIEHRRMPEGVKFRLQRFFRSVGPVITRIWPDASLHMFWRMTAGEGASGAEQRVTQTAQDLSQKPG